MNSAIQLPTVSVVIPTYNRARFLRDCLQHVQRQSLAPEEVVVVDASPNSATREVVQDFPWVTYLQSPHGRGTTATSRALGIARTSAEVVAFLDDDAYPQPTWLEQLALRYEDPQVAGVGGRAINGQAGEEQEGVTSIGRLLPDGSLTGFFAAIPETDVEVDHMLGANMSMRSSVIEELGGIRDFYPGTCLREESDIALRARAAGYRLIYTPDAVVRHLGGTYAKGRRFDLRYEYYSARNHAVLLLTALGPADPRARANFRSTVHRMKRHVLYAGRSAMALPGGGDSRLRGTVNGLARASVTLVGTMAGYVASHRLRRGLQQPVQ